jgi:hypothetical protein
MYRHETKTEKEVENKCNKTNQQTKSINTNAEKSF